MDHIHFLYSLIPHPVYCVTQYEIMFIKYILYNCDNWCYSRLNILILKRQKWISPSCLSGCYGSQALVLLSPHGLGPTKCARMVRFRPAWNVYCRLVYELVIAIFLNVHLLWKWNRYVTLEKSDTIILNVTFIIVNHYLLYLFVIPLHPRLFLIKLKLKKLTLNYFCTHPNVSNLFIVHNLLS